jgi:hypothetical protein
LFHTPPVEDQHIILATAVEYLPERRKSARETSSSIEKDVLEAEAMLAKPGNR